MVVIVILLILLMSVLIYGLVMTWCVVNLLEDSNQLLQITHRQ